MLQAPETAFLVVAAPEPDAIREAEYFAGRLAADRMPLFGLVLNKVTPLEAVEISAAQARSAAERIAAGGGPPVTAELLAVHADLVEQAARQAEVAARFGKAYPAVAVATAATQPADVHDIDGLRAIGSALAGPG